MTDTLRFSFTATSANSKTGPIAVSMTGAQSCPSACPLSPANGGGCYAASGLVNIHWSKITKGIAGISFADLLAKVKALPRGALFRHNVAGDLPSCGPDRIDADALAALVRAAKGRRGFTYTHYPITDAPSDDNVAAIRHANASGFTINASANSPHHADYLASVGGFPVVTILPIESEKVTYTPQGRRVVVCPAVSSSKVTCATCGICADSSREYIIGFPAHGTGKKRAARLIDVERVSA